MIAIIEQKDVEAFLQRREIRQWDSGEALAADVKAIIDRVRREGDAALLDFTHQWDGARLTPETLKVPDREIDEAVRIVGSEIISILQEAAANIRDFALRSLPKTWVDWRADGSVLGQKITPLGSVALYAPGGRAAYPSSLLMGAVPARAAGVERVIALTPPGPDGTVPAATLAAARTAGVDAVYRVGGAQAIAAVALGTETLPRVDKIVGPGNAYVAEAKRQLFGRVGIDMVAGPSEVVIVADDSADPVCIAADLLAQAEHDPLASSLLITADWNLAQSVAASVEAQAAALSRQAIIRQALEGQGAILLTDSLDQAVELTNSLAPEHLGLHLRDAWSLCGQFRNAGALFLGGHAPEALGDYWAGPNHILPTAGTARFASPLGVEDFVKRQSLIGTSAQAIRRDGEKIIRFAQEEGLDGHANAIRQRLD